MTSSSRLEFPLAQGWSKNLSFVFEDQQSSAQLDLAKYHFCKQVHGAELYPLSASDMNRAGQNLAEADGLWAQGDWLRELKPRLLVRTADCIPILLVDHKNSAVAAIHAGWRGLQKGIHRVPFESLSCFDPKTTWLWLGPSLNGSSFEVGPDMYSLFPKAVQNNVKYFAPGTPNTDRKYFNAWEFLTDEYASLGVELVYNCEVNTFQDTDFASYRRSKSSGTPLGQQNLSWLGFL